VSVTVRPPRAGEATNLVLRFVLEAEPCGELAAATDRDIVRLAVWLGRAGRPGGLCEQLSESLREYAETLRARGDFRDAA